MVKSDTNREWSKQRYRIHREAFPPEEKAERNRQAQADFRARHRKRIDDANTVRSIILRQDWYPSDAGTIASIFNRQLGAECVAEVVKALTAPIAAGGKTKTKATTKNPTKAPLVWNEDVDVVTFTADVPGDRYYQIQYFEEESEMTVFISLPDSDDLDTIESIPAKKFAAGHLARAKAIAEKHWQAQGEMSPAPTTETTVELPSSLSD